MIIFEKIKYYLRQKKFYTKYLQTSINDCRYFARNCKYYCQKYTYKKDKVVTGNTVFFIIDPQISHPGLVDRFKAIIGSYYIAKQSGFNFKIIFDYPFSLHKYLNTNKHNWVGSTEELSYSIRNSRIISYNGSGKIPTLNKKINQYHIYCYIGYDILLTNHVHNYTDLWSELFQELFRPQKILQKRLEELKLPQKYIAVHLRFVNALENFEENQFNFLSEEKKQKLIERCLNAISSIINKNPNKKIYIFSDSQTFLDIIQKLPIYTIKGPVGHISFHGENDAIIMKTFIDFYAISQAEKVIQILAPEMYNTVFSYYAAILGKIPCEQYYI
ncbi:hypothetical protein [Gabonia massiliensis]|uniref:hypothetical protein n=1 Tax=Gabonia massiliensis TaxID=1686296 RepID=UPI00214BEC87|nr:hypothetical protein [Gabonia massiliensis]